MKKLVASLMLTFLTILSFTFTTFIVKAETDNDLVVKFDKIKYTIDNYEHDNILVYNSKKGLTEVATVFDANTGEVLETIELIPNLNSGQAALRSGYTYSHTLRRRAVFGGTSVYLDVHVNIYTNGSFRQINSVNNSYLGISSAVTNTYIEGQAVSVYSVYGFPTTSLKYSFSGTLVAVVNNSASGSTSAELLGSGFTFSYSTSQNTYYRRWFNQNGTISIY